MTYKENITAILECYFAGFKKEIIDNACNRILEQEPCDEQKVYEKAYKEGYDKGWSDGNFIGANANKWVPVSEKLPEEKTTVLLSCDDMYLAKLNPCIGWVSGNNWYTFSAKGSYLVKYPIAWMPLPEPYKAESEET